MVNQIVYGNLTFN